MKIRIKKNAYVFIASGKMKSFLKDNEDAIFEVDTASLFNNQYNLKDNDFRIYDAMIDAVYDDARVNKGRCIYCGKLLNVGEACYKYEQCTSHQIDWFTPENTFFLKYPNSFEQKPAYEILSIHKPVLKAGTYYVENFPDLDYYRIYNARNRLNFKYKDGLFYIFDGIGYTQSRKLGFNMPIKAKQKLIEILNTWGA